MTDKLTRDIRCQNFNLTAITTAKKRIDYWLDECIKQGYGKIEVIINKDTKNIDVLPTPRYRHK